MKRAELEKYLNKEVKITIFDGDTYNGILHKSGEEMFKNNLNLYIPEKRYFVTDYKGNCVSCMFRSSHIKKIKIKEEY